MNRQNLIEYIENTYNCKQDHPWAKYPDYEVFRHPNNKKWFALIMNIPQSRLGLEGEETVDVVNLKCDPLLISALIHENGFFPA